MHTKLIPERNPVTIFKDLIAEGDMNVSRKMLFHVAVTRRVEIWRLAWEKSRHGDLAPGCPCVAEPLLLQNKARGWRDGLAQTAEFCSPSTSNGSQLPVTPAPGNPKPSSGLYGHCTRVCIPRNTQVKTNPHKTKQKTKDRCYSSVLCCYSDYVMLDNV